MASPIQPLHHKAYPAIDPSLPALSTKGKSVVITGAGSGIGAETALAFAKSGASHLGLVGRRAAALESTKATIAASYPSTTVHILPADMTGLPAITAALQTFSDTINQKIDILVANAGWVNPITSLAETDPTLFWRVFEINILGNYNLLRAFAPVSGEDAVVLDVSTAMAVAPYLPGYAAYQASKVAAYRVFQHFGNENANVRVMHFHPGLYRTEIGSTVEDAGFGLQFDESEFLLLLLSFPLPFLSTFSLLLLLLLLLLPSCPFSGISYENSLSLSLSSSPE